MAETLQKKLIRMNSEILALKSSQTKPASLRIFSASISSPTPFDIHTIYYAGSGYSFAPIVRNSDSVVLLPYDPETNSQQFYSIYLSASSVSIIASREIDRIV